MCPRVLYYDCETTGLPNWHAPSDDPSQPRIIQLAAIMFDDDREVACINATITPNGWEIPEEVARLTGISTAMAERYGVPIAAAIEPFLHLWRRADLRVAHNEKFDARMIRTEMKRSPRWAPYADRWKAGASYCTMDAASPILNLPPTEKMIAAGYDKPKPPKLSEAYRYFFDADLEGAHDALVDVRACQKIHARLTALEADAECARTEAA